MLARPFSLEGVPADADPGVPLAPATLDGATFRRQYTKATVTLDCANFTSSITFS